jgi:16S rRNA (uracil1498-N3)-methyltransferase
MHRFYVPPGQLDLQAPVLEGAEWRHCQTVLRVKEKQRITIFDGKGNECLAVVEEAGARRGKLKILEHMASAKLPFTMTLIQALPKNRSMDWIVQKATELGVSRIVPVTSERSVVQISASDREGKMERWRQLSVEAAKQCGLNWLPEITPIRPVKDVVEEESEGRVALIASLQPDSRPLWQHLASASSVSPDIVLMIGPEGDFTPAEMNQARSVGFQPLSLGPLILRSETAVVYALSVLSYELTRGLKKGLQ